MLGAKHGLGSSEFQNKAGVWMKKDLRFIGADRKSGRMSTWIVGKKTNGKYQFDF